MSIIKNESTDIRRIRFRDKDRLEAWMKENNIEEQDILSHHILGYNRIVYDITIDDGVYKYVVIERFDGRVDLISSNNIDKLIEYSYRNKCGMVANAEVQKGASDIIKTVLLTDDRLSTEDYIPSKSGILYYLHQADVSLWKEVKQNIETKETCMNEQQYQGLLAKLKMIGTPYILVDINTILIKSNGKALLYTKQKDIDD
jgi:hypothetical protein